MNNVLVIHERDNDDRRVIGVADSATNAEKIIDEYYGHDNIKIISHGDIRDSNLEWSRILEVLDHRDIPYRVCVWLEWFELNKL
jgi:hypothetical protein